MGCITILPSYSIFVIFFFHIRSILNEFIRIFRLDKIYYISKYWVSLLPNFLFHPSLSHTRIYFSQREMQSQSGTTLNENQLYDRIERKRKKNFKKNCAREKERRWHESALRHSAPCRLCIDSGKTHSRIGSVPPFSLSLSLSLSGPNLGARSAYKRNSC